ncbi:aldehyde dehydrogenase (NAD+) [Marchantia polymorpha subsp. ruderalis]|uniref:Aldehyde dehydrogenase domain-containing protein n=1 Tax=Marchantia polymorpha TaxID=3197 RepID=A0A2R6X8E1_MARPO|nr:hypothetical protein MARPO_0030s0103 [Marchantia polymorpha]BBN20251.1 hypothetical protein Mp_8g17680 [Marchantia polymorpha subsp. ruderalis]|eukprot:PTQ42371.1 hypothetical protein MARPO_0030s0103 [Marchantia polymorpha]
MATRKALGSSASLLGRIVSRQRQVAAAAAVSSSSRLVGGARSFGAAAAEKELESPVKAPVEVKHTKLLINGEFVDSVSGKTFATYDPRSEELIAHVAEGDAKDIDLAVKAARKAFDEGPWPKMTAYERVKILNRYADLLEKHNDELGALDSIDSGKPYDQARYAEMPQVVRNFRYFAGWADKIHGHTIPSDSAHFAYTLHEPVGVCGQIIPWNFPLVMYAWKVAPALACGNTIVLKTAEQTPLSALLAGALALEAGIPPGVLNIVSGYGETAGAALSSHMDVDKVAFTGSTEVGKKIMVAAAQSNLKKVTLELGGKSPFIICDGADVDQAVELSHFALFFNQGQCCCAGSRTFVHENVYDEYLEKAKERALKRIVGDPFRSGVEQGPQVDKEQFNKVLSYIESGKEQGARLITGGTRLGSKGFYIKPTVFADVQDHHTIFNEEIFGPVQAVTKFSSTQEVIKRANRTEYGLAAGIFSKNIDEINTLSRGLRAGTVWVNTYDIFDASIPFGGYKQSGIGREKGIYALENYTQVKAVVMPLHNPAWL